MDSERRPQYAPQWLHLRDRAKRMLNSLLHFRQDASFTVYSGAGPLSNGIPLPSDMLGRRYTMTESLEGTCVGSLCEV